MTVNERKKILVVDDDNIWLETIENILQSDYDLTLTSTPLQALEEFKKTFYSLVILDLEFQGQLLGLEIFNQLEKLSPKLRAIILTGHPDFSSQRNSFKMGVLDYLIKSSDNLTTELRETVKESLQKGEESEILDLIAQNENEQLEFKSSTRWDFRTNKVNKELEKVIVKTIAAFLNSEKGGILLIGVDDNQNIVGLRQDYTTIGKKNNRDGYENFLIDLLLNAFGKDCSILIRITFHQLRSEEICRIVVAPSPKPVFVTEDKGEYLYIRTGNSTRQLSTREAIDYCKIRWKS